MQSKECRKWGLQMTRNLTLLGKTVSRGVDNILVGPWSINRIVASVKGEGKEGWKWPREETVLHRKDGVSKLYG